MKPLADRLTQQEFWAAAHPDTMDAIIDRIRPLVESGRRMTRVHRWLHQGVAAPEVATGLTIDDEGFLPGVNIVRDEDHTGIKVLLKPGVEAFGVSAYREYLPRPRTEADLLIAVHDWERDPTKAPADVTHVEVDGFGKGRSDRIRILRWNHDRVGTETIIVFDQGISRQEQAEADAALLDRLAQALGGPAFPDKTDWNSVSLTALAKVLRENWRTLDEELSERDKWVAKAVAPQS